MHELAPIIIDLAVILGIASLVTLLFQVIHQPVVLGYLVAGMIIGPHFFTYSIVSDIPNVQAIAELGVIFLMFSLGLEFSFHKLASVGFSASITGLLEVVLMMIFGFAVGEALGWGFYDSLFLGGALSISSTTIIIKALEELNLKGKRFAHLIFGVLIVEDLLAILLLVGLTTMVNRQHLDFSVLVLDASKLVLVVGGWFLVGYFVVPYFFRRIIDYASQETLTIVAIAFCLLLVCSAAYFDYSPALGAFIMGSILAETPQVHRIEELIRPIRDIFAAVFFVSVGMLVDPKLIIENYPVIILISVVTVGGKILSAGIGALLTGQSLNTSLRVGFGMAQIGEFSFIIAALGLTLGVTSEKLYPIIVAVSVITTFTTPYLIRLSGALATRIEKQLPERFKILLTNYSKGVYRALADSSADSSHYRKLVMKFMVNCLIVAIIFTLVERMLMPYLFEIIAMHWLVKPIAWLCAMLLASPFIWAMLFSVKSDIVFFSHNKNSALQLAAIIWLVAIGEVIFLSVTYFHSWAMLCIFFIGALLFFGVFYARLEKFYFWFEKSFLANLNPQKEDADQLEQLAPWDSYMVSVKVAKDSPLANKTLQESEVRQKFGINIVAIHRQHELLAAPRGEQYILPNDDLIVLGSDEQLEAFKLITEMPKAYPAASDLLGRFSLKPILLHQKNPLIGKSIRDSLIRERSHGLIVGLERRGHQILNPDPATILEVGDLLLMVGEAEHLKTIRA